MPVEAGHIQLLEYNKEVIPEINWMLEDLFCRYGLSIPYYLLDFSFPDYQIRAEWPAPYSPEWLELYRPSLPPWPEMPWWNIPGMAWPEMKWPGFMPKWPDFQWPDWFSGTGLDWASNFNGFNFGFNGGNWGKWGYNLTWLNELLGLLFDEADIPRWQMPDFSKKSIAILNDYITMLYDGISTTLPIYNQVGTFEVGETITGETSGATGVVESATATVLTLTDVVGTFGDEMITGETSEAYAWTYALTELPIYNQVGTFEVGETVVGATSEATGVIEVATATTLTFSDVTGTFSDEEKVTGQTSGAYAWTNELAEQVISITYETPSFVRKYGYDCEPDADSSDAWDNYDSSPSYETGYNMYCNFICGYGYPTECDSTGYTAIANKLCFKFDTTGVVRIPETATITLTCKARNNTGLSNPTLRLYSQDYGDEVDIGDWGGGILVDSYLLDVGSVWPLEEVDVSFSVGVSYVNREDWSKFKLNFKEVDENTHPDIATGFACQNITDIKLTLTY